ncbi:hypothetical protein ACTMS0_20020 [Micromonospora sp. H33]|uniref:hypothetical protein n=1 Tax=Micromonospora sp. H33 TaxID=3452215 RepID=UPI003F88C84E
MTAARVGWLDVRGPASRSGAKMGSAVVAAAVRVDGDYRIEEFDMLIGDDDISG